MRQLSISKLYSFSVLIGAKSEVLPSIEKLALTVKTRPNRRHKKEKEEASEVDTEEE
jgi:hypothetical protein